MVNIAKALVIAGMILFGSQADKPWQPKESMKYVTKAACARLATDMDITICYDDINPADPLEDEVQYMYGLED
jgi:hypothetical protein